MKYYPFEGELTLKSSKLLLKHLYPMSKHVKTLFSRRFFLSSFLSTQKYLQHPATC